MLDRITQPEIKKVDKISFIEPVIKELSNGIKVLGFNIGSQEVIQLEFTFFSGSKYQKQSLTAGYVSKLIGEASKKYTPGEIMNKIDYFGAFLETGSDRDISHVTLFTIQKQLNNVLPIFAEALKNPTFPERELDIHLKNGKQKFKVQNEKVGLRCRQLFTQKLFENSPYGTIIQEESYDNLDASMLKEFYSKMYTASNCLIVISGKFEDSIYETLEKEFGNIPLGKNTRKIAKITTSKAGEVFEEKEGAIQSGIRIGKVLDVEFGSDDYFKLLILNTVYGGYFGSRLMANIREDKGYTYGIGSAVASLEDAIFFFISTEVGADTTNAALKEIYKELETLRTDLIPKEELEMVKNYMMGSLLKDSDGPFSIAERFKSVYLKNENLDFYERYIGMINSISSSDLQSTAIKFLNKSEMLEVVVGKK